MFSIPPFIPGNDSSGALPIPGCSEEKSDPFTAKAKPGTQHKVTMLFRKQLCLGDGTPPHLSTTTTSYTDTPMHSHTLTRTLCTHLDPPPTTHTHIRTCTHIDLTQPNPQHTHAVSLLSEICPKKIHTNRYFTVFKAISDLVDKPKTLKFCEISNASKPLLNEIGRASCRERV